MLGSVYPIFEICELLSGSSYFHNLKRFVLDPPVYPNIVLYPAISSVEDNSVKVDLRGKDSTISQYPCLVICM